MLVTLNPIFDVYIFFEVKILEDFFYDTTYLTYWGISIAHLILYFIYCTTCLAPYEKSNLDIRQISSLLYYVETKNSSYASSCMPTRFFATTAFNNILLSIVANNNFLF